MKASAISAPPASPNHSSSARDDPKRSRRGRRRWRHRVAAVSADRTLDLAARPGSRERVSASWAWTTPAPVHGFEAPPTPRRWLEPGHDLLGRLLREARAQQRDHTADLGRGVRRGDLLADLAALTVEVDRDRTDRRAPRRRCRRWASRSRATSSTWRPERVDGEHVLVVGREDPGVAVVVPRNASAVLVGRLLPLAATITTSSSASRLTAASSTGSLSRTASEMLTTSNGSVLCSATSWSMPAAMSAEVTPRSPRCGSGSSLSRTRIERMRAFGATPSGPAISPPTMVPWPDSSTGWSRARAAGRRRCRGRDRRRCRGRRR